MNIERLRGLVRNVPDFPVKGVQFKDVTTLFADREALCELADGLCEMYKDKGITKVVGIESRGFIMGSLLAYRLNAGFIPIRKPGKLPADTFEARYEKEYGFDAIQIHSDSLSESDVVLIHDDLLATGGTMLAAIELANRFHPKKIYVNFLLELLEFKGRELFDRSIDVTSLVQYE